MNHSKDISLGRFDHRYLLAHRVRIRAADRFRFGGVLSGHLAGSCRATGGPHRVRREEAGVDRATEAEVAAALEKKYLDATKDFVKLKKNDELMFCKRYREIGTSIRQDQLSHRGTAAQTQVDNMDKYRDDMRNKSGKCTFGAGTGNAPCSAGQ